MATTRCLRCGNPILGVAQFCEDCIGQKRAEEEARAQRNAEARVELSAPPSPGAFSPSPGICPSCGNSVNRGANFCAWCRTQLRDDVPLADRKLVYAGFWIRLLAWIIDGIIVSVIGAPVAFAVSDPLSAFGLQALIGPVYTIGFWVTQGATPGKMALGLRITTADREQLQVGGAIVRYVGYFISSITLGVGYLMIAFTAEKRGLHDFIAGTMVIKTR